MHPATQLCRRGYGYRQDARAPGSNSAIFFCFGFLAFLHAVLALTAILRAEKKTNDIRGSCGGKEQERSSGKEENSCWGIPAGEKMGR